MKLAPGLALTLASAFLALHCTADGPPAAPRGQVALSVAPLTLQEVGGATWRLVIEEALGGGAWGPVVDRQVGSDGPSGAMTYVAPCVAGESRVSVTLVSVTDTASQPMDVMTPPTATKSFTCVENADVLVEFDITVMSAAKQGFFDITVNYEDVFCSAKIDCNPAYLHHPVTGERGPTVITALTCSAGPTDTGETTYLGLAQAYLCCSNGTRVECTLLEQAPRVGVLDTKRYAGANMVLGGLYLNTAWRLDEAYLAGPPPQSCVFSAMGFVNTAPAGQTPATTYQEGHPAFHWYAEIDAAASCAQSAMDVSYSAVPPNGTADCSPLPDVGPDQPETCNGRDDNCDGTVDEGFVPGVDCVAGVDADCPCVPPDADSDGIPDAVDSCPYHVNPGQGDIDNDAYGDSCDDDMDGDGVTNGRDNCPGVANPLQEDANFDGTGDACEGLETACGDGVVQLGEQCDWGIFNSDFNSGACRTSCLWGYCGDSVTDPPAEACDDGNDLAGDGCEPDCTLAPLGGGAPPTAPILFGRTTTGGGGGGGGGGDQPADPYSGWEAEGLEVGCPALALPVPQACATVTEPGQPVDASLTSTVFDLTGFDTTATLTFTAAVTPSVDTGLNPAISDGSGGVGGGGGASGGFGGATGTAGAFYGGNAGGAGGGFGGAGGGSGGAGGTGDGSGGYYSGGAVVTGALAGYTSGDAGVGGEGSGGAFTGDGYPGSQVTTYVEVSYDGGQTWHVVEAIDGYWEGQQSVRIPLYDPTDPNPAPGPGFQVRLRCEGVSGPEGFYFGVTDVDLVPASQNQGPSLSPRPSELVVQRGEVRVIDFAIDDPDAAPGPLAYLFQGPDFASFQDLGGGQGRLTLTPSASQPYGWYSARLQYSDGAIVGTHWVNLVVPAPTPPAARCVKIRSAPNGGGVEVGAVTLTRGQSTTFYAAAYSDAGCTAYVGEANVYWRHGGTLPETTVGPFAVYYYTAYGENVSGTVTTEHPNPAVTNDATGTITLLPAPAGALDPTRSTLSASPSAIPADGASETTLTVRLVDSLYRTVTSASHVVAFNAPATGTLVGAVTQNADGTWSQRLRASTTVGPVLVGATVDGQPVDGVATVSFTENRDSATLPATSDNTITCADVVALAGQDLIVSTTLTIDIDPTQAGCEEQLLYLRDLIIKPTGTLTHAATSNAAGAPARKLNLSVANLVIERSSPTVFGKIDVSMRGYAAQRTFGNTATHAATGSTQGGSHAGLAGVRPANAHVYGDFRAPAWPGSGSYHGAGGGVVQLLVRPGGSARVDGQILANGSAAATGAAGGSILLDTPVLTGVGSLSAQGGAATGSTSGGGGGGRIALVGLTAASGSFAVDTFDQSVLACGGNDNAASADYAGGAGSVYYASVSGAAQGGILVFDACGRTVADGSTPLNVLPDGTYTQLTASQFDTVSVPTVAPTRFIGSQVALTPIDTFDGLFDEPVAKVTGFGSVLLDADLTAKAAASGAYRGYTVVGLLKVKNNARINAVGDLYVLAGGLADPNTFTLDGTIEAKRLDLGNANAVVIQDQGHLRVTERLIARNQRDIRLPFSIAGGKLTVAYAQMPIGSLDVQEGGALAGTGGVVYGDAVFDTPNFASNPITGFQFRSDLLIKSGSFNATDISVGGDLSVFGGTFLARFVDVGGSALFDAGAAVTFTGRATPAGDRGLVAAGDIVAQGATVGGTATKLTHYRPSTNDNNAGQVYGSPTALSLRATNVRVVAPALIDVSGQGWAGPYGPNSAGPFHAQDSNEGGAHGGRGAADSLADRPHVFDSLTDPRLPGGGGYTTDHYGGGAVLIEADLAVSVSSIEASAHSLTNRGGAGGTINLRAGESVRVDGALLARGGNGDSTYRAGGGGRIAVVAGGSLLGALATDPRAATDASGGAYNNTSTYAAGAGTVYLRDGAGVRSLIVDNAPGFPGTGRTGDLAHMADGTPLPVHGQGLMSAVGGGVLPTVPSQFVAQTTLEAAPLIVGQQLLVLPEDVVFTVTGVEAGTGAWLLDGDRTGLTGAGHTWCVLLDLDHLDVTGHAQLQHSGCVRVAAGNVGDADPTSWALAGGVNVGRLDLGPATTVTFTTPLARFDVATQLGAAGGVGYPFDATVSGRLVAQNLLLGDLSVTTAETARPTVDVGLALVLAGDYSAVGSPQPVELEASSVTVDGGFVQQGGFVDVTGAVVVKRDSSLSDVTVTHTGPWTVTGETAGATAGRFALSGGTFTGASVLAKRDAVVTGTGLTVSGAFTVTNEVSGATGAFTQSGGAFTADALAADGPVSFTSAPVRLYGLGAGLQSDVSLTFSGGATVLTHDLHAANTTDRRAVRLAAPVVEFLAGARIDVAGKGFQGVTNNGYAPLAGLRATSSGGSHGGKGGSASESTRAPTYDNLYAPLFAGGGGNYTNAHGGGAVRISATARATLGAISASGVSGSSSYGGGAGGAIYVDAPLIEVLGLLDARGASGAHSSYRGGGGGMIALVAGTTLTNGVGAAPWDMVDVRGGAYAGTAAGSGTLYTVVGAADGDLLVDNRGQSGTERDSTPLPFAWYGVASTAPTSTVFTLTATPPWPPAGYRLDPSLAQPLGAVTPSLDDDLTVLIGEHAAPAAALPLAAGDPTAVWTAGATGCAYYRFDHVTIRGNAQLTVQGCMRVDDGGYGAADPTVFTVDGGLVASYLDLNLVQTLATTGPSGRIDIGTQVAHGVAPYPFDLTIVGTLTTTGLIAGNLTSAGATVTVTGDVDVSGVLDFTGVTLVADDVDVLGQADLSGGTSLVDAITAGDDLRFDAGQVVTVRGQGAGLVSTGGDVIFTDPNTRGTHSAHGSANGEQRRLYVEGFDVTVDGGAVLDVSGRGYPAGYGPSATFAASSSKGASHGGRGAHSTLSARVEAYDDLQAPTWAGGGGGVGSAPGGGVLRVHARHSASLDTVRANANPTGSATPSSSAGGAGGAIWLSAVDAMVVGALEARGADGFNTGYAGGGGGRAALYADTLGGGLAGATYDAAFDGVLDLRGGGVFTSGAAGAGTAFLQSARFEQGALIIDNESQASQRDSTPLRGGRGVVSAADATSITVASTGPLGAWTPVGRALSVDAAQGTASLADNDLFVVTGQSGARLFLDADPTALAPVGKTWAFAYALDHLEISGNAQVDAADALVRVADGSLVTGLDADWRLDGGLADPALESEGAPAGLVLDLDAVTDLMIHGATARFDVPTLVQGATAQPAWSQLTTSGAVELDQVRVQQLAAGDVTGSLHDVRTLETVGDLTLAAVSFEATGYGAGLVAGSAHTLTLASGTTATHQAHGATGDLRKLGLQAGTVSVAAGATINVDAKGYAPGQGPSTVLTADANEGGSHCGRGYAGTLAARPPAYDDLFAPVLAGAGGGDGPAYGGGVVRIDASTLADIRGTIRAEGQGGSASTTTGGAGGSIWVTAPTIHLEAAGGTVSARGGSTTNASYEPGGGGCIALVAANAFTGAPLTGTAPWTNVGAYGGAYTGLAGGAGTVFLRAGAADGDLLVDNNGAEGTQDDSTELPWLPVGAITAASGNTLTVSGATLSGQRPNSQQRIRLVAAGESAPLDDEVVRSATAASATTLTLDGDATPFAGQGYASYYRFDRLEIRGNAHLVTEAHVRVDGADFTPPSTTWALHGALVAPYVDLAGVSDLSFTGPNTRFDVPKDVNGVELDARWNPVGWSGTLRLPALRVTSLTAGPMALKDVHDLHVQGDLSLTNVSCDNHSLTSGSPGCDLIDVSGSVAWSGGFVEVQALRAGVDLALVNTDVELHGHATGLPVGISDGLSAGRDASLSGASFVLDHDPIPSGNGAIYRASVAAGRDLTVADGAKIDVSAMGYRGNSAPNAALVAGSNVGGSHLGLGGASTLSSRKPTYDAYWAPALPGAGGGGTTSGGAGGGVVRLHAGGHLALAGDVLANGAQGSSAPGGAGGAIYATSDGTLHLAATADLAARGGNGTSSGYGGGGGGIALVAPALQGEAVGATPWARLKAYGGLNYQFAGAGTVYLKSTLTDAWGHLVVDNGDQVTTQLDSTPVVFQGAGALAGGGVAYDAGAGATTLTSTVSGFTTYHAPLGFFVNPRVGQPVGAVTPTLGDDLIYPVTAASAVALTVTGDASAVAVPGGPYIPHYRFDTLTVRGHAQLAGDAEIYVRDGHWQDGVTHFSVTGGVHVTSLDLNTVTTLSVGGPQGRWEVDHLYAQGSATPRFDWSLAGTVTVAALRSTSVTASGLTLTLLSGWDVLGDLSLTGSSIAGSGAVVDVSGAFTLASTNVNLLASHVGSASITGGTQTIGTFAVTGALAMTNANFTSTTTTADSVSLSGGVHGITNLTVTHALTLTNSADLTSEVIEAESASFDGPQGDIRFRSMDVTGDVTFSGGTRFEQTGRDDDGVSPDGLFAGGTVLLTGTGSGGPTAGTHSAHGTADGEHRALRIEADTVRVNLGAVLDVDGKGYPGRNGSPGYAPSSTYLGAAQRHGGSHFGLSYPDPHTNRKTYDNLFRPEWAGAGGGQGFYQYSYSCSCGYYCTTTCYAQPTAGGGAGGGVILVSADALIDLDGPAQARGLQASNAPGGAGGAITLEAPVVRLVNGQLKVNGGQGAYVSTGQSGLAYREQWGGGGGGVAVLAHDHVEGVLAGAAPWGAVDLRGGLMNGGQASGAGTFFMEVAGVRSLIIDNGGLSGTSNTTLLPFSGGSTVSAVSGAAKTLTSASNATFTKWAPAGYVINPNVSQTAALIDADVFAIEGVSGSVFTLDDDPSGVPSVVNATWRPFYDLDYLEVRGQASVYLDGQILVRQGSYTPVGTAGTTAVGTPGQIAVGGGLTVTGTGAKVEVLVPAAAVTLGGLYTEASPASWTDGATAPRCDAYLDPPAGYAAGTLDGVYLIDPDGAGGGAAFPVYCDMTTDGGGWTKVESASHPHFFGAGDWDSLAVGTPTAANYSILAHRGVFAQGGCTTLRLEVGNAGDWTSAPSHFTVWQQCHDAFTQATNGSGYTFIAGEAPVTCGGFNGLHAKYQGWSRATDVDTGDGDSCWWMQVVPTQQYPGSKYLDGYGGQNQQEQWQALWMRAGALELVPAQATLAVGDARTFTARGGRAPYTYTVRSIGGGAFAGAVYTAPSTPGVYLVRVTDALGAVADGVVTVNEALSVSPAAVSLAVGAIQSFTAAGGVPPYTYSVASGGGTLTGATYTAPGTSGSAVVRVTDALGHTADAAVTVTAGNFQSSVLLNATQMAQINTWIGTPGQSWVRCYHRGTHGTATSTFHAQCDARGPSVTVISLSNGRLIGGYASVSWNTGSAYFGNSSSFLYSLTNSYKHSHIQYTHYLYGNSNYGPTWGGGHDLHTGTNTIGNGAYCNLGHNYACRVGTYGSDTCRNDFCGVYQPTISDLEVFVMP